MIHAFLKQSTKGIVYVALYIDDNLMIGIPDAIDEAVEQLKKNDLVLKGWRVYGNICQMRSSSWDIKESMARPVLSDQKPRDNVWLTSYEGSKFHDTRFTKSLDHEAY